MNNQQNSNPLIAQEGNTESKKPIPPAPNKAKITAPETEQGKIDESAAKSSKPSTPNKPSAPTPPSANKEDKKGELIDRAPAEEVGKQAIENLPAATSNEVSVQLKEYGEYENVSEMLRAAQVLIESGVLPNNITEPEQVVGIMKYGDEVGLSAMTALNNIHMIQGRPTLGIHVITALLKRNNIQYRLIEDYVGVQTADQVDARTTFEFIDHSLLKQYEAKLQEYFHMDDATKEMYKPILETLRESVVKTVSYYWSQAAGSGLTEKENWRKDPRNMMRARCLATGARMVKPEALLGFYETAELAEAMNSETEIPASYTIDTN